MQTDLRTVISDDKLDSQEIPRLFSQIVCHN